jgi:hypothetical protein
MIIRKGDYTFCGEDVRPHRWALKIGGDVLPSRWWQTAVPADKVVELKRLSYKEFEARILDKPKLELVLGAPSIYYVSDNGAHATMWPRPDKDYELIQLPDG